MSENPLPPKSFARDANPHRSPISPALSRTFLRFSIAALLVGAAVAVLVLRFVLPQQPERVWGAVGVAAIALVAWLIQYRGHWRMRHALSGNRGMDCGDSDCGFHWWRHVTSRHRLPLDYFDDRLVAQPVVSVISAGLTVAATLGLVAAEQWGWLTRAYAIPLVLHGVDQIIVYIMAALIAVFVVRVYQKRIDEAGTRPSR